jgi:Uma2 family endonuclease
MKECSSHLSSFLFCKYHRALGESEESAMQNLERKTSTLIQKTSLPLKKGKKKKASRIINRKMIEQLPADSQITLHNVRWEEYERLLEDVGEASGWRISYDKGEVEIMVLSPKHENYSSLLERMISLLSLRLRIKTLSFGSMTMKKGEEKGSEPDCCFYIQSANLIGKKKEFDFSVDPPPDVVVEIDVHHKSDNKFSIYASLGVPEFWLYDEKKVFIYLLRKGKYVEVRKSKALPMLTSKVLTTFLNRSRDEDQYETLLAFEEWLISLQN